MFFRELENLANEYSDLQAVIELMDSYLSANPRKFLESKNIAYHTSLEPEEVERIVSLLIERSFLVEEFRIVCPQCNNRFQLSGIGYANCDICDPCVPIMSETVWTS